MAGETSSEQLTVLFVDLVKFTSLTDVHGDLAAADAAGTLESVGLACLADGARIVKTLGDGILVTAVSPASALRTARCILERLHEPDVGVDSRSGAHHGPVIDRGGDVFGSTVNLASRVTALAHPGHIVVTRLLAEAASELELTVAPLGMTIISGFVEPVELFEINLCEHDGEWISDPVCGMRIAISVAVGRQMHGGREVGFCSANCAEIFNRTPQQFI